MKIILGYTSLNLLVAITLVSILMAIAIPSFKTIIENSRLEAQSFDVSTVFSLARMEAIDKSVTMTVCSSSDQATCRADADKNNWADGWILFRDINANGVVDTPDCSDENKDCVIRVWSELAGSSVLTSSANFFIYDSDGRLNSAIVSLTLTPSTLASCGVDQKRVFAVTLTGKVNMIKSDC